jgi:hypothetical protein
VAGHREVVVKHASVVLVSPINIHKHRYS